MSIKPNFGDRGQRDYVDWARYVDEDYDVDTDPDARVFIAYFAGDVNLNTAVCALLNCDSRKACPRVECYDETEAWLKARGWPRADRGSPAAFESEVLAFLDDLNGRYPWSKKTSMTRYDGPSGALSSPEEGT